METTKDRFLQATTDLFRSQGYSGTGLKEIAKHADAPWGSLYHFFPGGKEQLAHEAVLRAGGQYRVAFAKLFERVADPVEAVSLIFRNEIAVLEKSLYRDGCPIAATALDIVSSVDSLRQGCDTAFKSWIEEITAGFVKGGIEEDQASSLAVFVLASLEGAIILARTSQTTEPLAAAERGVRLALQTALA